MVFIADSYWQNSKRKPKIRVLNYYPLIKQVKQVALVLNVFVLILSAIHVKQSLVNPDECSSSKTVVIDVYFIRMLVYALYITSGGVTALRWRAAGAVPCTHAGTRHAGGCEYLYFNQYSG